MFQCSLDYVCGCYMKAHSPFTVKEISICVMLIVLVRIMQIIITVLLESYTVNMCSYITMLICVLCITILYEIYNAAILE